MVNESFPSSRKFDLLRFILLKSSQRRRTGSCSSAESRRLLRTFLGIGDASCIVSSLSARRKDGFEGRLESYSVVEDGTSTATQTQAPQTPRGGRGGKGQYKGAQHDGKSKRKGNEPGKTRESPAIAPHAKGIAGTLALAALSTAESSSDARCANLSRRQNARPVSFAAR